MDQRDCFTEFVNTLPALLHIEGVTAQGLPIGFWIGTVTVQHAQFSSVAEFRVRVGGGVGFPSADVLDDEIKRATDQARVDLATTLRIVHGELQHIAKFGQRL